MLVDCSPGGGLPLEWIALEFWGVDCSSNLDPGVNCCSTRGGGLLRGPPPTKGEVRYMSWSTGGLLGRRPTTKEEVCGSSERRPALEKLSRTLKTICLESRRLAIHSRREQSS